MPELPDVEVFKEVVDATSLHQAIAHTHVRDESLLSGTSRQKLARAMSGRRLESTRRHGKHLGVQVDESGWLLLHFGMTGAVESYRDPGAEPEYSALVIDFEGGAHLAFTSRRRFGKIAWTEDFDAFIESEQLGPDAFGMDLADFRALIRASRGGIKSLLMSQDRIAGLGNVYSDEALFRARIAPERPCEDLSDDEIGTLHRAMRRVLETAIERRADPEKMPDSWLLPRREKGERCPRCGGEIEKSSVAGRSSWFCQSCQR